MKKQKMIKFTLEFEHPTLGEAISVTCPYCKAPPGTECRSRIWPYSTSDSDKGGKRVSGGAHHDRFAVFMNLEVISPGSVYRIKP